MSLLYHYCSVSVMESIITNRVLWLSNALKTNDSKEYKYFGEALTEYAKNTKTDSKSLLNVVDMIIAQCTVTKEKRYTPYICCFSEADDLLSQWRGYGDRRTSSCGAADGAAHRLHHRTPKSGGVFARQLYLQHENP